MYTIAEIFEINLSLITMNNINKTKREIFIVIADLKPYR